MLFTLYTLGGSAKFLLCTCLDECALVCESEGREHSPLCSWLLIRVNVKHFSRTSADHKHRSRSVWVGAVPCKAVKNKKVE